MIKGEIKATVGRFYGPVDVREDSPNIVVLPVEANSETVPGGTGKCIVEIDHVRGRLVRIDATHAIAAPNVLAVTIENLVTGEIDFIPHIPSGTFVVGNLPQNEGIMLLNGGLRLTFAKTGAGGQAQVSLTVIDQ